MKRPVILVLAKTMKEFEKFKQRYNYLDARYINNYDKLRGLSNLPMVCLKYAYEIKNLPEIGYHCLLHNIWLVNKDDIENKTNLTADN